MKNTLKNTFFLLAFLPILAACTPTASKDLNAPTPPIKDETRSIQGTPLNEASMEAAQKSEVENMAVRPPQQEAPSDPPAPILPGSEETSPSVTDPQVLKAGSAKSLQECGNYEGNLKEICFRSVGFPSGENTATPGNEQN